MNKLIRHALPIVAIILYSGVAHALPNSTGTGCECYYDSDCPDTPDGKGVCWHGIGCTYNGDPFDPSAGKVLDGMCGFIGPGSGPSSAGSSCGSVSAGDLTKVLKAWASGYDKAGAKGGGPVGRFTARAYKLSHQLIPSVQCRFEISRKALDLQALSRSPDFLGHPDTRHDSEDHSVQDISDDPCRQQIGRLSARALLFEILGEPEQAAAQLSRIPEVCPAGQTLGGRCDGSPDEIACLADRLQVMAQFFASQPRGICGDGVVSADEQCELDHDCGPPNRCMKCLCVTTVCGLALCGNGQLDPAEECDDGNTADNDPCQSCKVAVCGDGIVCNDPSCAGGTRAAVEQCDPPGPDTVHCPNVCLPNCRCDTP